MNRLSYEDSLAELIKRRFIGPEERCPLPPAMPSPLDDGPRLSFFRTELEGDLSHLSLPRTLICRTGILNCRLVDTDLSESFLCWNDFTDVDFSSAILKGADFRTSIFTRVCFAGTDLSGADLRRTTFEDCDFTGAGLAGAKMTRLLFGGAKLSSDQKEQVEWSLTAGDEPPGG